MKVEQLTLIEQFAQHDWIDLYYGDESHVCSQGYVPYGWQFPDEDVYIASERSIRINCFGLIRRNNDFFGCTTLDNITSEFVCTQLDHLSLEIGRETVVVLDNASVHRAKCIKQQGFLIKTEST